jgi:hypothetical protein
MEPKYSESVRTQCEPHLPSLTGIRDRVNIRTALTNIPPANRSTLRPPSVTWLLLTRHVVGDNTRGHRDGRRVEVEVEVTVRVSTTNARRSGHACTCLPFFFLILMTGCASHPPSASLRQSPLPPSAMVEIRIRGRDAEN